MNIQFQGKLSREEFRRVLELHTSRSGWLKWTSGGLMLLLGLTAVGLMVSRPETAKALLPGLIFPIAVLTLPFWISKIQAAAYDQSGNIYREGLSGTITDDGISVQAATGNFNTYWNAYTAFKQTDDMIILYQNKNCMNIFSRAMFSSAADWELFCGEVGRRLKKK